MLYQIYSPQIGKILGEKGWCRHAFDLCMHAFDHKPLAWLDSLTNVQQWDFVSLSFRRDTFYVAVVNVVVMSVPPSTIRLPSK
jgi:hypothetical protein